LTPESYEEIATAVFIEMALAGITTVGEFHYVHHQPGGMPYAEPTEMGEAVVRAARRAGIGICLLDAGYFSAGFGDRPLSPVQKRFRDPTAEDWVERASALAAAHAGEADVRVGLAPHSVRAVPASGFSLVSNSISGLPVHVHVSEQPAENTECLAATGLTPTALLADTGILRPGTTLVHATHVSPEDISAIGASGAGVCYCATTERDLADGIGPAAQLRVAGAELSVGSDSHAVIDIFEEARGLEMHARLASGHRGVFSPSDLLEAATTAGSVALGFGPGGLRVGSPADFIVVDSDSPRLAGCDLTPDSVVFAATSADVTDTIVRGRRIVQDRRHDGWGEAVSALRSLTGE
jgi:formiminoglutamate deiminase